MWREKELVLNTTAPVVLFNLPEGYRICNFAVRVYDVASCLEQAKWPSRLYIISYLQIDNNTHDTSTNKTWFDLSYICWILKEQKSENINGNWCKTWYKANYW